MARSLPYTLILYTDPAEGGFIVSVPAFPGMIAEGWSRDDTLAAIQQLIADELERRIASGSPVPPEADEPEIITIDTSGFVDSWV